MHSHSLTQNNGCNHGDFINCCWLGNFLSFFPISSVLFEETEPQLRISKISSNCQNPPRRAQASGGKFTCFEKDWL